MNDKYTRRITEYLDSECSDYGLKYSWEWSQDTECCEVKVLSDISDRAKYLSFKYDESNDDLSVELTEDSFFVTREFDHTVKYFWMLVSPALFPE